MPGTTFANMQIVPDTFTRYVNEDTTKKSALVRSGVATSDDRVATVINGTPRGGNRVQMPFYKELEGEDEVFGEDPLTPTGITTSNEMAALHIRGHAWSRTDLSAVKGGDDPMSAIGSYIADWWVNREQALLLSVFKGLFDATGGALKDHILDVSGETGDDAIINVDNTLSAKQLMGDAYHKLGIAFMHSATFTRLQKQQQITTEYDSDLKIEIQFYLGYQIVIDDEMPYDAATGVYDTFLAGRGAIARNEGMPAFLIGTETDRDSLGAEDILINRRAFTMHPLGVSFVGTPSKEYATNADMELATNWKLVKQLKNVPLVCLRHRVTAAAA